MSRWNLTVMQRQRLRQQLQRADDVRLFRRTLAVLEFDRGRTVSAIAEALGVSGTLADRRSLLTLARL